MKGTEEVQHANIGTDRLIRKGKDTLSLHTPWNRTEGAELQRHSFLFSTPHSDELWHSRHGRFNPKKGTPGVHE